MRIVPLEDVPSQTLAVTLANQPTQLTLRTRSTGLYIEVYLSNALVIGGVICQDRNRIIRDAYFGYIGDFAFYDTQGTDDPVWTGLGTRWLLVYLEAADLAAMGYAG